MVRVWKPKPIGKATLTAPWNLPNAPRQRLDCFVALLLAMTARK
jgi:hypothetical protein